MADTVLGSELWGIESWGTRGLLLQLATREHPLVEAATASPRRRADMARCGCLSDSEHKPKLTREHVVRLLAMMPTPAFPDTDAAGARR